MNKLKELEFNVAALLYAVKEDNKFFAAIFSFVEKLDWLLTKGIGNAKKGEIFFLAQKVEDFFENYRSSGDEMYIPPPDQISTSDKTAKEIFQLANDVASLDDDDFQKLKPGIKDLDKISSAPAKTEVIQNKKEKQKGNKTNEYGKWKIVDSLAEGGQGQTFIVQDTTLKNDTTFYVLKRLKNIKRFERFQREVEIGFKLEHPNILKVIDFNLEAKKPYMITPYCQGGNLKNASFISTPSALEKLEFFLQICEGVAFAHEQDPKVIHRDLKPENIFISGKEKKPTIGDFGICFVEEDGKRLTITEEAVGPRLYMAPELEDGRLDLISPSSDIYSLGKVLYWLLSGNVFSREKHREKEWDLTELVKDGRYEIFNRLFDKMIVAEPHKRFQTVREVISEIDSIYYILEKGANIISDGVTQECIYCRKGKYRIAIDTRKGEGSAYLHNFGLNPTGSSMGWMILICEYCGNTQIFRTNYAKNPEIWSQG